MKNEGPKMGVLMNDYIWTATMICVSSLQVSFIPSETEQLDVSFCGLALCEGQKGMYLTQE